MPVSIEAKKKSCVEALANTEFARYTIFRLKEIARDHPPGRPAGHCFGCSQERTIINSLMHDKEVYGMRRSSFAGIFLAGLLAISLAGAEFDPVLEKRAELWNISGESLVNAYPGIFQWVDVKKSSLRFNRVTRGTELSLFGHQIEELVCEFNDGKLSGMDISFYNRGDAGAWDIKRFNTVLNDINTKVGQYLGSESRPSRQSSLMDEGRVFAYTWRMPDCDLMLRWSITNRKEPEYIFVELYPPGGAPKHLRSGMKVQVPVADLKQNIQMDSNGAFFLDIPMVDQGAKGYCVAATVARVLKYYGADVDQHLIAQLAKSDADRGTNINQTIESLEKTQSRLGIRVRSYYTYEINTWKDIMKMIKDYNRVAKRNDVEEVDEDDFILKINGRRYLNFRDLMNSFDFDTFCKFRSQDRRGKENFFEQVRESIDEGLPLCWSTFILPGQDEANSEFGLHMRIINGYNPTTREIVYSDSWGAGHEKKTMSNDAAWGITINLFGLVPRNRRTVR